MDHKLLMSAVVATMVMSTPTLAQDGRDHFKIVGSPIVYPYTVAVAEHLGSKTPIKSPLIEATENGKGISLFCSGIGPQFPDIVSTTRPVSQEEMATCKRNEVKDLIEVQIGYDGMVVAGNRQMETLQLSREDLYKAISKRVPDPSGQDKLVENPYKSWHEINPALPDLPIVVIGPPKHSPELESVRSLLVEPVCEQYELVKALKGSSLAGYMAACGSLRRDSGLVEGGASGPERLEALQKHPNAVAILKYGDWQALNDQLQAMPVDGVTPSIEKIAVDEYPLSQPLYLYVKKAHWNTVSGLKDFMNEFTLEQTWGPEGYLAADGLIPLETAERNVNKAKLGWNGHLASNN